LFTANDCLDVGRALGSPVSLDYRDRAPFAFTGTIHRMRVAYRAVAASATEEPRAAEAARA
jgi:arylsulfatase